MADDLLIKINADAKNVKKEFDDIRRQTEDLEGALGKAALVSGIAFAALTAEVFASVHAFEEAQQSSVQLSNALQNQGIFTNELKESYEAYAKTVQDATGIDNDAIIKSQAIAQTYLGQREVTEELTFAIADLSATMGGDLNGAAEKIARTIGTGTNAFAKQGLVISETATESERYAKVLEFVNTKAGGLAAELNRADGYSKALTTSFGNFQESIGERFAPIIAAGRQALISFFDLFTNNPALADLAVAAISAGLAISGIIFVVAALIPVFLGLSAAAAALSISVGTLLLIPIAIAAIVTAVIFLAQNWDRSMKAVSEAAGAAVTLITELFSGLGKVLSGAFSLDSAKIKEGLNQVKSAFVQAKNDAVQIGAEFNADRKAEQEEQNKDKKAAADKAAAIEAQHQANLRAIRQAEIDLFILQNENASAAIIALKQKELETLKALDSEKSVQELAVLRDRQTQIKALQEQQQAEDLEREAAFREIQAQTKAEFEAQGIEVDAQIRADKLAQIEATAQTEADVERKLQEDLLNTKINARNRELLEKKKYGATYAAINKSLNSDEVTAAKSAADGLVQLSNSKNSTLKAIGKAAAITQIGIDTAKGAMSVYANFQTAIPYPPVSIPLGIAAAAAIVAYGAERIGNVTSAATGGLIEGGIPGRDSVPALLEPGELVVPRKNFNDVVGAVGGEGGAGNAEILAALQSIDQKISTPQTTIIQGDVQADDSYIDALVRKISDAIEFRNGQIAGVTS